MECEFVCNFKDCRKIVKNEAWVTSCSHIFCCEDGEREFHKALTCPACETELSGKFDIIKVNTNPNEQFKAIILAGLQPEIIMEIASRAISFWSYQTQYELQYRQSLATKCKEQQNQMEGMFNKAFENWQAEKNNLAMEVESSKIEVINQKQRCAELSEKLIEKTRQLQKMQSMYENLRRKLIPPLSQSTRRDNLSESSLTDQSFQFPLKTPELSSISMSDGHQHFTSSSAMNTRKFTIFENQITGKKPEAAASATMPLRTHYFQ